MTPTRSSAGSAPRTLRKPKAKRSAAVKSSPTGPREARREAVPLDGRAQRSYPNQPRPHHPNHWVRKCGCSIKGSDTPHLPPRWCASLGGVFDVSRHDVVHRAPCGHTLSTRMVLVCSPMACWCSARGASSSTASWVVTSSGARRPWAIRSRPPVSAPARASGHGAASRYARASSRWGWSCCGATRRGCCRFRQDPRAPAPTAVRDAFPRHRAPAARASSGATGAG
jgi:hypothetical protein